MGGPTVPGSICARATSSPRPEQSMSPEEGREEKEEEDKEEEEEEEEGEEELQYHRHPEYL